MQQQEQQQQHWGVARAAAALASPPQSRQPPTDSKWGEVVSSLPLVQVSNSIASTERRLFSPASRAENSRGSPTGVLGDASELTAASATILPGGAASFEVSAGAANASLGAGAGGVVGNARGFSGGPISGRASSGEGAGGALRNSACADAAASNGTAGVCACAGAGGSGHTITARSGSGGASSAAGDPHPTAIAASTPPATHTGSCSGRSAKSCAGTSAVDGVKADVATVAAPTPEREDSHGGGCSVISEVATNAAASQHAAEANEAAVDSPEEAVAVGKRCAAVAAPFRIAGDGYPDFWRVHERLARAQANQLVAAQVNRQVNGPPAPTEAQTAPTHFPWPRGCAVSPLTTSSSGCREGHGNICEPTLTPLARAIGSRAPAAGVRRAASAGDLWAAHVVSAVHVPAAAAAAAAREAGRPSCRSADGADFGDEHQSVSAAGCWGAVAAAAREAASSAERAAARAPAPQHWPRGGTPPHSRTGAAGTFTGSRCLCYTAARGRPNGNAMHEEHQMNETLSQSPCLGEMVAFLRRRMEEQGAQIQQLRAELASRAAVARAACGHGRGLGGGAAGTAAGAVGHSAPQPLPQQSLAMAAA